jgi:NADH-quinone oxidoreductase subunit C
MTDIVTLGSRIRERFSGVIKVCDQQCDEVTIELAEQDLVETCLALRDEPAFEFKQLMDVTCVDYLAYGQSEWETTNATSDGFDRAANRLENLTMPDGVLRFVVVYHLLSLTNNQRLRIKVRLAEERLVLDSVTSVWSCANWYEREAYDLFGVVFKGHNDLRRILTDYGFVGHPFRKDFPVSGHVQVRYDEKLARVIYEPVDIEPRINVPKVIRPIQRKVAKAAENEGEHNG